MAPLVVVIALALGAIAVIGYVLWPRWPGPPIGPDAPALPITVAGVAFNVPPAAIRVPVQRRPGAHERVDLAFAWPSLEPPDPNAKQTGADARHGAGTDAGTRAHIRDHRRRRRHAAAGRARADDLSALRRDRSSSPAPAT